MCHCRSERLPRGGGCTFIIILVVTFVTGIEFFLCYVAAGGFSNELCPISCSTNNYNCCYLHTWKGGAYNDECPCGGRKYEYSSVNDTLMIITILFVIHCPFLLGITIHHFITRKKPIIAKEQETEVEEELVTVV